MNFSTTPDAIHAYRQMKYTVPSYSKRCKGGCNRSRSTAQFAEGSDICKQCQRRMPK